QLPSCIDLLAGADVVEGRSLWLRGVPHLAPFHRSRRLDSDRAHEERVRTEGLFRFDAVLEVLREAEQSSPGCDDRTVGRPEVLFPATQDRTVLILLDRTVLKAGTGYAGEALGSLLPPVDPVVIGPVERTEERQWIDRDLLLATGEEALS